MQSAVDEAKELLDKRLGDLDEEKSRLEAALKELNGSPARSARKPGRPRKATAAAPSSNGSSKPRKRKGGNRADQCVELITKEPGIAAAEVAKRFKMKPNYLYRVLGALEKEGRIKKDGRQYFPGK